ncbi:Rha family phage regulatory protein [Aureimonas pseudogalii]|uniref:Rha family phage regulatory protein n=2 Tax=Aureimonas pseudogalii TaxID=1744844 RepID=A0A7W6E9G8_9HYPH|nr:Rha family phage regulatory protein [Aureimonas pseudogalii]
MSLAPVQGNGVPFEQEPIVFQRNGEVFANSRDVASFFEKRHDHVIRDIDKLIGEGLPNFGEGFYTLPATGSQQHRCFEMDRRGFTILSMGFTGKKALRWKLRYIDAFEAMEAELLQPRPAMIDYSDPAVMLGVVNHLQAENAKKDEIIAEQSVQVKKLERLEAATGSMCLTDAAKTLNMRRDDFIRFLDGRKWIFKRPGNKNWLAYDDKRRAGYLEHDDHLYLDSERRERVSTRCMVTAKGLVKIAELLNQPLN